MSFQEPNKLTLIFLGKVGLQDVVMETQRLQTRAGLPFFLNMTATRRNGKDAGPFAVLFEGAANNKSLLEVLDDTFPEAEGQYALIKEPFEKEENARTIKIVRNDFS